MQFYRETYNKSIYASTAQRCGMMGEGSPVVAGAEGHGCVICDDRDVKTERGGEVCAVG